MLLEEELTPKEVKKVSNKAVQLYQKSRSKGYSTLDFKVFFCTHHNKIASNEFMKLHKCKIRLDKKSIPCSRLLCYDVKINPEAETFRDRVTIEDKYFYHERKMKDLGGYLHHSFRTEEVIA